MDRPLKVKTTVLLALNSRVGLNVLPAVLNRYALVPDAVIVMAIAAAATEYICFFKYAV